MNQNGMNNYLIRPQLINQFPDMSKTASNWISLIPQCKWVENYFSYLNENLRCLKSKQRDDIIRRLVSTEDEKYHEAIAELAYISLWKHLNWSFEKDPNIGGQTPDFKVSGENFGFFCDVAVVRHNHPHEHVIIEKKEDLATPLPLLEAPIEQSHRFLMKINDKSVKYKQISTSNNIPLVIAFFQYDFGDQFFLDDSQLRVALFGDKTISFTTGEVWHQPKIIDTAHGKSGVGIFAFDDTEHKHLSAVILCKQESCRISNELQLNPKPHYPLKYTFAFSVYPNPFGEWTDERKNPFPKEEFSVNGLVDIHFKTIYAEE